MFPTREILNRDILTGINTIAIASCISSLTVGAKAGGIIHDSTLLHCGASLIIVLSLRDDMRD
jgi:hypothetical protein